jgi:TusA-related sulfurtransferase
MCEAFVDGEKGCRQGTHTVGGGERCVVPLVQAILVMKKSRSNVTLEVTATSADDTNNGNRQVTTSRQCRRQVQYTGEAKSYRHS